jgi:hypothetical protein
LNAPNILLQSFKNDAATENIDSVSPLIKLNGDILANTALDSLSEIDHKFKSSLLEHSEFNSNYLVILSQR